MPLKTLRVRLNDLFVCLSLQLQGICRACHMDALEARASIQRRDTRRIVMIAAVIVRRQP